jgi:cytochrome c-type biogenesis protein CcmH
VFIYAKAIEGPKLPLAIIKSTAGQLPTTFILSDEQSMSPQFKLSQFKEVSLTARISKSGNAIPEKGDLIGYIPKLKIGEKNIQLIIQDVQP